MAKGFPGKKKPDKGNFGFIRYEVVKQRAQGPSKKNVADTREVDVKSASAANPTMTGRKTYVWVKPDEYSKQQTQLRIKDLTNLPARRAVEAHSANPEAMIIQSDPENNCFYCFVSDHVKEYMDQYGTLTYVSIAVFADFVFICPFLCHLGIQLISQQICQAGTDNMVLPNLKSSSCYLYIVV